MQDRASVRDENTTPATEPAPGAEHAEPVTEPAPATAQTGDGARTGEGLIVKAEQRARQVGEQLKHTARQTSETVMGVSDQRLQQAASGLDEASAVVRSKAEVMRSKADRMAQASEQAAVTLRQAAGNLRNLRDRTIFHDTADYIRNNPSVALTASVIAGFIVGSVVQTGSLKESIAMLTGRNHEQ